MTYDEVRELKKNFFTAYSGPVMSSYYGIIKIKQYIYRDYGSNIYDTEDRYHGLYSIIPIPYHPKKGDIIETFDGIKYIFQNTLKASKYSCLIPNTRTSRYHINYGNIKSINNNDIYVLNEMLNDLLKVIK